MPKWFNIAVSNDTPGSVPLKMTQDLTTFLIERPEEYDASIVRFDIPNYASPLFKFQTDFYYMSMSYNGHSVTFPVAKDPIVLVRDYIYAWQSYIYMVNDCLQDLWTALNALIVLPSTVVPFFAYDESSRLTSLIVDKSAYLATLPVPIKISVNDAFLTKIGGFPMGFNGQPSTGTNTPFQFLILDLKLNTSINPDNEDPSYKAITMTQQDQSFDNIIDLNSVVITTNLPIVKEFQGSATALPIMNDFVINDVTIATFRNRIVYNAITPYRQVHMQGSQPFRNISFDIFYSDAEFNLTPVSLGPNQSASIKIMFTEKRNQIY